jgi:uncharacterized protein (TIGR02145 family)
MYFGKHNLKIQARLLAVAAYFFCMCSNVESQGQTGILRDRDGNIYSIKLMPDNKRWMTANLKTNIPGSYGYDTAAPNNHFYGRLYTWKAAQEGCKLLAEGWRLPTNEEWQKMAGYYGGVRDDSGHDGKSAYIALTDGGSAAFNAVYGGRRDADSSYSRVDAHGFYWTATETDATHAWLYNFGKNGKMLNRHPDGEKQQALSVRCIRDGEFK